MFLCIAGIEKTEKVLCLCCVRAPEKICNKIKLYFIDLFFSLRSSKANFSDKLSDKGTIDWFGSRKLIKASECQKRKEEVQLNIGKHIHFM